VRLVPANKTTESELHKVVIETMKMVKIIILKFFAL
jgi:hypothetical protein